MKASWSDYDSEPEASKSDEEAYMATEITKSQEKFALHSQQPDLDDRKWYTDSGCSHHISGKKSLFTSLKPMNGGKVLFVDNVHGKIIGRVTIGQQPLSSFRMFYWLMG
ncbi:unnamed protein product [Linum trigynum]|uniref:Retrovirus-related Pol polyprotein from transposon TNT 1-94-like beta-barrel domain-containing protein n=1 Tax=Linum trigynum TaxID=586398 RepID=A0AAV2CBJ9_9ROSI